MFVCVRGLQFTQAWLIRFPGNLPIMAVHLDQIVPWGRSRREYELMFGLTAADLSQGVLDCGGGPASFAAEISREGYRAVAVDPIYAFSAGDIRARFEATAEPLMAQVRGTQSNWNWTFHRDPDDLLNHRRTALEVFLADYERGLSEGRYLVGELPTLPFAPASFGLAVCSHLLFLYSDLLTAEFHIQSLRELCRVARDVRAFPLLNLRGEPSPHLGAVRSTLEADGWATEIAKVDYEFQHGGDEMLRVSKR
ncbi:MAG TPA: hypothetical protein VMM36_00845 [Opitutaceae bacterium]|nr:hypothetical protein [Opitutaceae bacterium]